MSANKMGLLSLKETIKFMSEQTGLSKRDCFYALMNAWREGGLLPVDLKTGERVPLMEH